MTFDVHNGLKFGKMIIKESLTVHENLKKKNENQKFDHRRGTLIMHFELLLLLKEFSHGFCAAKINICVERIIKIMVHFFITTVFQFGKIKC